MRRGGRWRGGMPLFFFFVKEFPDGAECSWAPARAAPSSRALAREPSPLLYLLPLLRALAAQVMGTMMTAFAEGRLASECFERCSLLACAQSAFMIMIGAKS